jgi:putative membrane protein
MVEFGRKGGEESDMMGGGFGFMWIFWIAIIVLIIFLLKPHFMQKKEHSDRGDGSALEVLKERYARGEISKAEFEQKKKDLE